MPFLTIPRCRVKHVDSTSHFINVHSTAEFSVLVHQVSVTERERLGMSDMELFATASDFIFGLVLDCATHSADVIKENMSTVTHSHLIKPTSRAVTTWKNSNPLVLVLLKAHFGRPWPFFVVRGTFSRASKCCSFNWQLY